MKPHHLLKPSEFASHLSWMKHWGAKNFTGVKLAFDASHEATELTRNAYPHEVTKIVSRLYDDAINRKSRMHSVLDDICLAALEVSNETHA